MYKTPDDEGDISKLKLDDGSNFRAVGGISTAESDSSDSSYYGVAIKSKTLPTSTQKWTTTMLQSLGILYDDQYHKAPSDILDKVNKDTGIFGPLTDQQKEHIEGTKNSMSFDCSIGEFVQIMQQKNMFTVLDKEISNVEILRNNNPYISLIEDFIISVKMMLTHHFNYCTQSIRCPAFHNAVPKDRFVYIFGTFARICNLHTDPGSAWRGEMTFGKSRVVSIADLILLPRNFDGNSALSVVSVVEVKPSIFNMNPDEDLRKEKTRPKRSSEDTSTDSEVPVHQDPEIYNKVPQTVLGQHGGELLIHHPYYRSELNLTKHDLNYMNYLPGVIVIGTEVVFTLLKIDDFHVAQLKKTGLCEDRRAKIYYSEPKDLLQKKDRDELLESLARLCNVYNLNFKNVK